MKFSAIVLAATALLATSARAAEPPPPKLVVAIAVDQFSADLFAQYRQTYTGGMRRLTGGVVFASGYQSHGATETCPGHSTILTGDRPARTGVIANNWWDFTVSRTAKQVYCAEDPALSDGATANYVVTANALRVPTLGDRMKAADARSRIVAVAGKDRAAVMMGGKNTDQIWFWRDKGFATLPGRTGAPASVAAVNARVTQALAKPAPARLPASCRQSVMPVTSGARTLGVPQARAAGDLVAFRASAELDDATTDLAVRLVKEMKLGQGPSPDLLAISLSATDYVGHRYGPGGAEMCAQMAALDANIGRILKALDASGVPYVVALTADHGGHDAPERSDLRAQPAEQRLAPGLALRAVGDAVAAQLGLSGQIIDGEGIAGDIYLTPAVPAAMRPRAIAALKARLQADPQVEAVFTAEEIRATSHPTRAVTEWSLIERFRESYDAQRSGDLVVALRPNVTSIIAAGGNSVATHGSPWDYDRRVPIVFYRPGMAGFEQPLPIETVDIAPSLAALIGVRIPAGDVDGRCLDLDAGPADSCKRL